MKEFVDKNHTGASNAHFCCPRFAKSVLLINELLEKTHQAKAEVESSGPISPLTQYQRKTRWENSLTVARRVLRVNVHKGTRATSSRRCFTESKNVFRRSSAADALFSR